MGPFQDEFGASSSPVLVDGKVILNQDHDTNSFIIALNTETGKTVWKISRPGRTRSYSTPIIWDAGSHKQVIVAGSLELAAYNVHDGRKVWWVDGLSRIVDTTPVMVDGTVYLATWTPGGDPAKRISMEPFADAVKKYDKDSDGKIAKGELPEGAVLTRFFRIDLDQDGKLGPIEWTKHARVFQQAQNVAIAVRAGGEGNVTKSHVKWIQRRGLPTVPSPLVYHGIVYMVKKEGIVTTLDTKTGTQLKQGRIPGRGNYYASIVAGDGKVYLASERGVVSVLDAGRQWEVRGSHDFGERIMATPTIADGRVYLRTDKALYCFSAE
jgi:outer membrane protein assembly factor BamB